MLVLEKSYVHSQYTSQVMFTHTTARIYQNNATAIKGKKITLIWYQCMVRLLAFEATGHWWGSPPPVIEAGNVFLNLSGVKGMHWQ